MAWKRTGLKGINADDPSSNVKQGPGTSINVTGMIINTSNKSNFPGAIVMSSMDLNFTAVGANWDTDNISKWFRDDGNTTT